MTTILVTVPFCASCGSRVAITRDAVDRPRTRCPRCDGVARHATSLAPEHIARSQARNAPPVPPLTLPKNRAVLVVQPAYRAFVEVPERPAPRPSKYVPTEAETHPNDLPADHPRRSAYLKRQKIARGTSRRNRAKRKTAAPAGAMLPRSYQPKPCEFTACGTLFTPTGPRSKYCEACR